MIAALLALAMTADRPHLPKGEEGFPQGYPAVGRMWASTVANVKDPAIKRRITWTLGHEDLIDPMWVVNVSGKKMVYGALMKRRTDGMSTANFLFDPAQTHLLATVRVEDDHGWAISAYHFEDAGSDAERGCLAKLIEDNGQHKVSC